METIENEQTRIFLHIVFLHFFEILQFRMAVYLQIWHPERTP